MRTDAKLPHDNKPNNMRSNYQNEFDYEIELAHIAQESEAVYFATPKDKRSFSQTIKKPISKQP